MEGIVERSFLSCFVVGFRVCFRVLFCYWGPWE